MQVLAIYCWALRRQLHKLCASHGGWCRKIHHTPQQQQQRQQCRQLEGWTVAGFVDQGSSADRLGRRRIPFGSDGLRCSDSDSLVSLWRRALVGDIRITSVDVLWVKVAHRSGKMSYSCLYLCTFMLINCRLIYALRTTTGNWNYTFLCLQKKSVNWILVHMFIIYFS